MNSQPPDWFRDGSHNIDVIKACAAPHAAYMFGFMIFVNDLAGFYDLAKLVDATENGPIKDGVIGYLMRVQQAHIREAFVALFNPIAAKKQTKGVTPIGGVTSSSSDHPLYGFFKDDEFLLEAFDAIIELLRKNQHRQGLITLRNKYSFHYNFEKGDAEMSQVVDEFRKLLKGDPQVTEIGKLVLNDGSSLRYPCADQLINLAWRQAFGMPASLTSEHENLFDEYRRFLTVAGGNMIAFSIGLIAKWIHEYDLVAS